MKKIAFIIPYFGRFNNYFQLFLNSCSYNKDCDWIIFTDDKRGFDIPDNVKIYYTSFEKLKELFQSKFSFKISLEYPYKLCDYKPAYGYVFEKYLSDYRFWGYCDTDLLFGHISSFINDEDLLDYDKIGILGHCTIYRNTQEINTVFMKELNGKKRFREVFTSNQNCSFDEEFDESVNILFDKYGYKIRYDEYEANIYTKSSDFRIIRYNFEKSAYEIEAKKRALFVFDNGHLFRYEKKEGRVKKEEFMYLHMQSRNMKVAIDNYQKRYKIIPNVFEQAEQESFIKENFDKVRIKYFNMHYFRLRSQNLFKKIKKKIKRNLQ